MSSRNQIHLLNCTLTSHFQEVSSTELDQEQKRPRSDICFRYGTLAMKTGCLCVSARVRACVRAFVYESMSVCVRVYIRAKKCSFKTWYMLLNQFCVVL